MVVANKNAARSVGLARYYMQKRGVLEDNLLHEVVAAVLGPVEEPYVQPFPVPEVFFTYLLDGDFFLAECYLLVNPFWSWKMVLMRDPLYRPLS